MAKEVRQPGVELHGNSYRFRQRVQETVAGPDGGTVLQKVVAYERWPFYDDKRAASMGLPHDHPKRRKNALANANSFAIRANANKDKPRWESGRTDLEGTVREWLLRYRDEALLGHPYGKPGEPLHISIDQRAESGIEQDKSLIRTLLRLGDEHPYVRALLDEPVAAVAENGKSHFVRLQNVWAGGKAAPATKRRLMTVFSSAWDHHAKHYDMEAEKIWRKAPIAGDGREEKARALTRVELERIEKELDRLDPIVRAAIEFIRWTGCRRGEAAKLRWEDIKWPEAKDALPSVLFTRTKAGRGLYRERFTYLEDGAVAALRRMFPTTTGTKKFEFPKEGWVFPQPRPKQSSVPRTHVAGQTIYTAFVRSLKHAGVPHASPHHLRHTKATQLSAIMPQGQAMELLGHSDTATFGIYRHLAEEAGYLVRDRSGALVDATALLKKEAMIDAFSNLSESEQSKLLQELMVKMAKAKK